MKFDMMFLFPQDMARMVTFYRDVIGLETEWNGEEAYAEFTHEGIRFAMFDGRQLPDLLGRTPSLPHGTNGSFSLAINVGATENVDATYRRLVAAGAEPIYEPRDEPWKMRSAMIADPEGNLIEIGSESWE